MGFPRLNFSKLWTNSTDFPTVELDESQVRADMQELHDQAKEGLNGLMDRLEDKSAAGSLGAKANDGSTASTVQKELDALNKALTDAGNLPTGGSAGQMLRKQSDEDFDTAWQTVTPGLLGALDAAGGTMTGNLSIAKASAPQVILNNTGAARFCSLIMGNDGKVGLYNHIGTDNCAVMVLSKETGEVKDLIKLKLVQDGTAAEYAVLHEGNCAQFALPVTGGTLTGREVFFNGGFGRIVANDGKTIQMEIRSAVDDTNDRRILLINSSLNGADVTSALKLYDVVDGQQTDYTLFHTGNVGNLLGASTIVTGSYTGAVSQTDETTVQEITLGFRPAVVFVAAVYKGAGNEHFALATSAVSNDSQLVITDAGFSVKNYYYTENASGGPALNRVNTVYNYIAIG